MSVCQNRVEITIGSLGTNDCESDSSFGESALSYPSIYKYKSKGRLDHVD
jgi:hypothetical protein